jgi:hypothetical protein
MVRDVEVTMDVVVKMMVTVVDVGMIMVVVITLVLLEQIAMILAKGMKWLAKVMLQVEIMVLNMVVDLVMELIVIDYLGRKHCLLVLFMDLSKCKGKGKYVCAAHPNFCVRNRSVYVMSKWSVKESKHLYGESVPNDTVPVTIGRNKMDTHADTCCAGANWQLLDFTNEVCEVTPFLDL